ncbi:hypothetical protein [Brucella tritici]|uniref:Uncharacterized protein n=1 Tax=Brucella tritici TaxID=94626 RepID=A0A6L3YKG7_9HYPH|nr:hypothetical protein [Brucella tritici]KAB2683303.1 hypothetical protein F9L08_15740 [Brucella tritici]
MARIAKATFWIGLFSILGYGGVKLALGIVCWLSEHNALEAMFSATTSVILGLVIGVEAFLWFSDARRSSMQGERGTMSRR